MADETVFHASNGEPANFANGTIALSVNGTLQNRAYAVGSMTLGNLVDNVARSKGIRTFSVYADGRKVTTSDASKPAASFKEVDIVAKDARGGN